MHGLDPDLASLQEVREKVEAAHAACEAIHAYSQAEIDRVCESMVKAGAAAAWDLARLAVEETGMGRAHYKFLKNVFAAEGTWASIRDEKTVGIVRRDERTGIVEVATAAGVVAGVVPTTNPTSTALFKALIAVKGKNAIVISPHPRARRCIGETVEVLRRAIARAGAPADLVCALAQPTLESTGALMKHPKVALILATGGAGLVKAAYSSGKPAYGVGPGNVPCYVDRSADVAQAARWIVASQSFDNGTLCCSEQGLIADRPVASRLLSELERRGAHVCTEAETTALASLCNRGGHMNPDVVGLDPWRIASMAGFQVSRHTSLLLAHQKGVGPAHPLSIEILAPVLSVHLVDGWKEGCRESIRMLEYGGLGHTLGLWAKDEQVLEAWFLEKPANRIVVNGPTSEGAVGYSTQLLPSMSLGCGPQAGNITSDNISARHLINVKRVAYRRRDWDEVYARDHERAAAHSQERAPRGSGIPGDPALERERGPAGRASAFAPEAASSWQGNPPVYPRPGKSPAEVGTARSAASPAPLAALGGKPAAGAVGVMEPKVQAALKSTPRPAQIGARDAPRDAGARAVHSRAPLAAEKLAALLATAGQSCPMGPCRGCAHLEINTGACLA